NTQWFNGLGVSYTDPNGRNVSDAGTDYAISCGTSTTNKTQWTHPITSWFPGYPDGQSCQCPGGAYPCFSYLCWDNLCGTNGTSHVSAVGSCGYGGPLGAGNSNAANAAYNDDGCGYYKSKGYTNDPGGYCANARYYARLAGVKTVTTGTCTGPNAQDAYYWGGYYNDMCRYYEQM